jgi:hypothetical protein
MSGASCCKANLNGTQLAGCYDQAQIRTRKRPLAGHRAMLARLSKMIVSTLASFVCFFALFSVVCYLTDHDQLVMLHMYSSPVILSLAFGIIFLLSTDSQLGSADRVRNGSTPYGEDLPLKGILPAPAS